MAADKLSINQWAEEDRPREKMAAKGASALSDAELLAILIGSGSREESAVELMRRLLSDCKNNLNTLGKMSLDDLCANVDIVDDEGNSKKRRRYKGLGTAKAITILAACELGKRRKLSEAEERKQITKPGDLYDYFHPLMQDLEVEECYVLLMNQASRILGRHLVSRGGLTETSVDVRRVLREALLQHATVIALCHNHPSGNVRSSTSDDMITARLNKACELMNIRLFDHIIVADGQFYSYRDEGKL